MCYQTANSVANTAVQKVAQYCEIMGKWSLVPRQGQVQKAMYVDLVCTCTREYVYECRAYLSINKLRLEACRQHSAITVSCPISSLSYSFVVFGTVNLDACVELRALTS